MQLCDRGSSLRKSFPIRVLITAFASKSVALQKLPPHPLAFPFHSSFIDLPPCLKKIPAICLFCEVTSTVVYFGCEFTRRIIFSSLPLFNIKAQDTVPPFPLYLFHTSPPPLPSIPSFNDFLSAHPSLTSADTTVLPLFSLIVSPVPIQCVFIPYRSHSPFLPSPPLLRPSAGVPSGVVALCKRFIFYFPFSAARILQPPPFSTL
jgi:hypothetical protein